jgi:DNA-binding MarR family transcriptional regulator|nr:MarR family transcriptional regulator [Aeromicrobium sp.]
MTETTAAPATTDAGDLGQALAALLRRYLDGAREAVDDLPGGPRGFQVLLTSSADTCSNQATMALRLGIDRTVMTYLVDDLEKAGLVERRPDPADRRGRRVVLTPQGESVLAAASERIRAVESRVLGALSEQDAAILRRLIVTAAADAPPTDHSACDVPPC